MIQSKDVKEYDPDEITSLPVTRRIKERLSNYGKKGQTWNGLLSEIADKIDLFEEMSNIANDDNRKAIEEVRRRLDP